MSDELPPVRCVTCNNILGNKWNRFREMVDSGVSIEEALDNLGLRRICCRVRLMNPFKYVERVANDSILYEIHDNSAKSEDVREVKSSNLGKSLIAPSPSSDDNDDDEISLPPVPVLSTKKGPAARVYQAW